MPKFIEPVLDWLVGVAESGTPDRLRAAGLKPFAKVSKSWTGAVVNWPAAAVMPRGTGFDPEGSACHQEHAFTLKFGVTGNDPDELTIRAVRYMKALDDAIQAADWTACEGVELKQVFVSVHDYGPLYEKAGALSKFPEMHLMVEVYEF